MPITVEERNTSRTSSSGEPAGAELRFIVRGTDDDLAARAALESSAPAVYDGLPRKAVRVEPAGPMLWDGEAQYAPATFEQPEVGESSFSFDTGGGTQRITQSLATVASFAAPGLTAPDFKGAIGVTADSVEGVDIAVPVYHFTETHVFDDTTVNDAFKGAIFVRTGKVNSDAFRGFALGEVLFLGAAGSKREDGDWAITYRFAASPNATGLTVGDITGVSKKGWEYLWVRYEDAEDGAASSIVKRPVAAYVERVYEEAAMAGMGI